MLSDRQGGSGACGQDVLVHELLNHKREGVFVDIGANNGVTISNTYRLERDFAWTGIAVEPIPSTFEKLEARRSCHAVQGCVTPTGGTASFLEVVKGSNMLSTLAVNDVGLTARRLRKSIRRRRAEIREIEVKCFTFDSLLEKFGISEVDFLSVDTEGGELEILKSIDFARTPVRVISVENNYYTRTIRKFLEATGFRYVGSFKVDEIYVHRDA